MQQEDEAIMRARKECETALADVNGGKRPLAEVVAELEAQERKMRMSSGTEQGPIYAETIIQLYLGHCKYVDTLEYAKQLLKKRNQFNATGTVVVDLLMKELEKQPAGDKLKYVESLIKLTAGRIHLERQNAMLTLEASRILEDANDIKGSCDILASVQGDTVASFTHSERLEYAIRQIDLYRRSGDLSRAVILVNRVCGGATITKMTTIAEGEKPTGKDLPEPSQLRRLFTLRADIFAARHEWNDVCKACWERFNFQWDFDTENVDGQYEMRAHVFEDLVVGTALASNDDQGIKKIRSAIASHPMLHRLRSHDESLTLENVHPAVVAVARVLDNSLYFRTELVENLIASNHQYLRDQKSQQKLFDCAAAANLRFILSRCSQIPISEAGRFLSRSGNQLSDLLVEAANATPGVMIDSIDGVIICGKPVEQRSLPVQWSTVMDKLFARTDNIFHQLSVASRT